MIYNFDDIPERRGTGCAKWDEAQEGVIPMWVADMDFKAAYSPEGEEWLSQMPATCA